MCFLLRFVNTAKIVLPGPWVSTTWSFGTVPGIDQRGVHVSDDNVLMKARTMGVVTWVRRPHLGGATGRRQGETGERLSYIRGTGLGGRLEWPDGSS